MIYIRNFKKIEDAVENSGKVYGHITCLIEKIVPIYKVDNTTNKTPIYFWQDENSNYYCGRQSVVLGVEGMGLGNKL
jgi:hypothetical protein